MSSLGLRNPILLFGLETRVTVAHLWHSAASKYSFEDGQAASDNHVVADVLHDASGLAGHQSEQDGS